MSRNPVNPGYIPNQTERAYRGAPGGGLPAATTKWCFKCATDKPAKGGAKRGPFYFCAGCK